LFKKTQLQACIGWEKNIKTRLNWLGHFHTVYVFLGYTLIPKKSFWGSKGQTKKKVFSSFLEDKVVHFKRPLPP